MILRPDADRLLLVTQPDHAALAARLMDRCVSLAESPRRATILLAIAEHDNGWREPDAAPLVDAGGAILDFVHAPDDVRRGVWPRGVARLSAAPYAAALVAQHAIHVFARYRGSEAWTPFFDEMTRHGDARLARTGIAPADLLADYEYVRLGDLLSLAFCNDWRDEQVHGDCRIRFDGRRLTVSPDLFGGQEVAIEVPARILPNRPFASAADARQAFEEAPRTMLTGVAAGR